MSRRLLTTEQILTLLTETPPRITALTTDLAPAQLHTPPSNHEWSANDVLAHLRACADVWGNCITTILAEDTPTLRAIDPRTWIKRTNYPELDFRLSFHAFATQRTDLLAVIASLPHEGWSRTVTVTGAGKVLTRTVQFYAQWLARHERQHLRQVEHIVNLIENEV